MDDERVVAWPDAQQRCRATADDAVDVQAGGLLELRGGRGEGGAERPVDGTVVEAGRGQRLLHALDVGAASARLDGRGVEHAALDVDLVTRRDVVDGRFRGSGRRRGHGGDGRLRLDRRGGGRRRGRRPTCGRLVRRGRAAQGVDREDTRDHHDQRTHQDRRGVRAGRRVAVLPPARDRLVIDFLVDSLGLVDVFVDCHPPPCGTCRRLSPTSQRRWRVECMRSFLSSQSVLQKLTDEMNH